MTVQTPGWLRRPAHATHRAQLAYGADYNPEQWPREVWLEDVRLDARGPCHSCAARHLLEVTVAADRE